MRRRYGEDRLMAASLIALAIVAAFGALGPSRLLVILVAIVLGGAGSVARQGFDPRATAAPTATHGRAFARFETRFQVAWVLGAVAATAIGIPIQISLAIVAVGLVPAALLYVRSLREAQRATWATHSIRSSWPVDDSSTPPSGTSTLDRLAVTELSGVVDLARAAGMPLAAETVSRMDELRPSLSRHGRSTPVTSNGHSLASVSSSTDSSGGRAVSRARASRSSGAASGLQATATTR